MSRIIEKASFLFSYISTIADIPLLVRVARFDKFTLSCCPSTVESSWIKGACPNANCIKKYPSMCLRFKANGLCLAIYAPMGYWCKMVKLL